MILEFMGNLSRVIIDNSALDSKVIETGNNEALNMRYWRGTVGRPASTTTVSDDTVIVATPTPSATTITESEDKLYVYVQHVVDGTLLYPTANGIPDGPFMNFVVYRYEAVKKADGSYETNPNVKGERLGGMYTELPIGNAKDTEQVDNPGEYGNNIITDDAILKKIESIDNWYK